MPYLSPAPIWYILLGVDCTTGGIKGLGRASQQHVGGGPPRKFFALYFPFLFFFFSSLVHACSLPYVSLSLSHSLSFTLSSLSHRAFRFSQRKKKRKKKKKSKKKSSTRAFLGLSLTNLLFTLRRCCFFSHGFFNAELLCAFRFFSFLFLFFPLAHARISHALPSHHASPLHLSANACSSHAFYSRARIRLPAYFTRSISVL